MPQSTNDTIKGMGNTQGSPGNSTSGGTGSNHFQKKENALGSKAVAHGLASSPSTAGPKNYRRMENKNNGPKGMGSPSGRTAFKSFRGN